ncbi:HAUS augmin-like complex subunit 6 N-terminus-domain-containing protein [Parachaetomium inaequale]|uniref:HAUS augmin-like complex subunit 6 N-terminus-domain-containing protein n=1 Tax=Parachaetomium inaequale TaxID=2588326 RepID=A0AAN6P776_9PEZI|nr:HAUS augmin-like complex subunit 6 N-terminus-domain-containing protein [Parachaetomium inaequale]
MAHPNGTSSLSRARSTRVPASTNKPAQSAARGNALGIAPTTTAAHPTASPTAPSNVSLFLTNLRLLDLDRHPDWPDINALTFSTRDAAQGQKKRIQSVEWALYHLFRLWDPDEARNKLQPFFPPLDQVQSLNLRAALLRGLEQAKKNGVLGRDAVVRKTMLDECKGERLEEVLAVFSSAVLKRLVAERQLNGWGHPALAQTLALENRGYSGERTELTALVLAHKVSLRRMLDEKNAARTRFREFSDLLTSKEKEIARKREQAEAAKRSGRGKAVTDDQKREVWRIVRNNWTGDERWMEALLYGDSKSRKDGVLTAPYDRVWRRVQSGRLDELEDTSAGLLHQLDSRVRGQQERLEKWQGFRQRMFGKTGSEPARKQQEQQSKHKGIDLGFRAHETLHLDRMSPRKLPGTKTAQLDSHYEALINGLTSDLSNINPAVSAVPSFFQRPRQPERPRHRTADVESEPEVISDISDIEEAQPLPRPSPSRREPIRVSEEPAFEPVLRKAKTFDDEHAFFDDEPVTPSRIRRSATIQTHSPSARRRPAPDTPTRTPERRPSATPKPNPRPPSPPRPARSPPRLVTASPEPPPSPERPVSPTQELADQILASVSAASPSPVKKTRRALSLAERTRLSMARRTSHANLRVPADELDGFDEEEDAEAEADRLTVKRASVIIPIVTEPPPAEPQDGVVDGEGGYEDLAARTRRSMAGFEAARQKAQLERRRSLRKGKLGPSPSTPVAGRSSYFPAVDEEEGDSTLLLAEELISGGQEDDYAAVFMSRPKLKTSPVGTPAREFWD